MAWIQGLMFSDWQAYSPISDDYIYSIHPWFVGFMFILDSIICSDSGYLWLLTIHGGWSCGNLGTTEPPKSSGTATGLWWRAICTTASEWRRRVWWHESWVCCNKLKVVNPVNLLNGWWYRIGLVIHMQHYMYISKYARSNKTRNIWSNIGIEQ